MIYSDADFASWDDRKIIAAAAWGEARSLGEAGMQATINSAQNRVKSGVIWWGHDLRSCFLAHNAANRWQYDCFRPGDANRNEIFKVAESDQHFIVAMRLADEALGGILPDITSGADSYFDHRIPVHPDWSFGKPPCFIIEPHWYYRTVTPAQ